MFRIRLIKDLRTHWGGWIRKGEELDARILPGGMPFDIIGRPFQVIAGKFSGVEVPQTHAITVPKEKLYTENQYNELRNAWIKAANENDELKQKLEELQAAYFAAAEEKQLLREEINKMAAGKKVQLPREVAEAIDHVREQENKWNPACTVFNILDAVSRVLRTPELVVKTRLTIVSDWIAKNPERRDILVKALVNGYTVEQSPAERIKQGIRDIYEQWTHTPSTGDDQVDGADLAERIAKFVTEELKL